jgi:site-specific recombinase XerD
LKNTSAETILWYRKRLKPFADFCQRRGETPATFRKDTVLAYLRFRLHAHEVTATGDLASSHLAPVV